MSRIVPPISIICQAARQDSAHARRQTTLTVPATAASENRKVNPDSKRYTFANMIDTHSSASGMVKITLRAPPVLGLPARMISCNAASNKTNARIPLFHRTVETTAIQIDDTAAARIPVKRSRLTAVGSVKLLDEVGKKRSEFHDERGLMGRLSAGMTVPIATIHIPMNTGRNARFYGHKA